MTVSDKFIFKENTDGVLEFVGDFDRYYKNNEDPWGQSGQVPRMKDYYKKSRDRSRRLLETTNTKTLLVVGCGSGYTMNNYQLKNSMNIIGVDISQKAIDIATLRFPEFEYCVADIMNPKIVNQLGTENFDTVIFEQILWYLLEGLDETMSITAALLKKEGNLIVSNAFAREQRYGNAVMDGYLGAVKYFSNTTNFFDLNQSSFYDDGDLHFDCHFLLKRKL
jgi:SAM-dependent methyltransferase